jgi:hypothetical protein
MGFVPLPPPPTPEDFAKDPDRYWRELRGEEKRFAIEVIIKAGILALGIICLLFIVIMEV